MPRPAPFDAQPLAITLRGITNDGRDPSVDTWRGVTLPLLRQLTGAEGGFDLKINRRGAPPSVRRSLRAADLSALAASKPSAWAPGLPAAHLVES